jgi:hypothetical protein
MIICFIPSLHKIEGSFIRHNHQVLMLQFIRHNHQDLMLQFGDDFSGKNGPKYIIRKLFSSVLLFVYIL